GDWSSDVCSSDLQLGVGIHPSSVASRPKPRFRGTLEICLEQFRISLHTCHDCLLRAPLLCAPAFQTRLRLKMLVTIFAGVRRRELRTNHQRQSACNFATLAVCISSAEPPPCRVAGAMPTVNLF